MERQTAVIEKVPFDFPVQVLKHAEEAGEFHVVGYAATTDFDLQGDVINEEALKASTLDLLKNSTVLLNHDVKRPIGKVTKVEFDRHGLLIDVLISKTEPDVIQKIKEGVLNKFSIRGQVLERERKFMPEHDRVVNVIRRMALVEVSLVSVPANPEARAVGWYVSKALREAGQPQGGDSMPEEQIVIEEISKADPAPAEGGGAQPAGVVQPPAQPAPTASPSPAQPPAAAQPQPAPQPAAAQPAPAKPAEPAPAKDQPAPAYPGQAAFYAQKDLHGLLRMQLAPVFGWLERLLAMNGEPAKLAAQIKAVLAVLVGDAGPAPAMAASLSKEDLGRLISGEVKKQVEDALQAVPTLRKGLVRQEDGGEDVRKTFEGLTPEKKLRVALALQEQR